LAVYLDQWGWRATAASFIETWMREDGTPDAAMLHFVASLRWQGFRCHVASLQERNRAAYLRQTIGFERAFDETFFSCDLGAAKPDPAFYAKIQERLLRPLGELLLVDDSRVCVEAAHAAGWQAFHYEGPGDCARLATAIPGFQS
jgi:putative hydrolase of the HAD superfamily